MLPNEEMSLYDEFLSSTGPDRLQKILARYELFKMIQDVPGDIVECGVFKGSGIFTWVKLLQLFKPNNEIRVVGFDFFGAPRDGGYALSEDESCVQEHESDAMSEDKIRSCCSSWGFERLDLIAGDVRETTKAWPQKNLGARISMLYMDVDNYEGTLAILENLYPFVSRGGLIVFDEYALRTYGESDAVDEFFRSKSLRLQSIPWANTPSAFLVKE